MNFTWLYLFVLIIVPCHCLITYFCFMSCPVHYRFIIISGSCWRNGLKRVYRYNCDLQTRELEAEEPTIGFHTVNMNRTVFIHFTSCQAALINNLYLLLKSKSQRKLFCNFLSPERGQIFFMWLVCVCVCDVWMFTYHSILPRYVGSQSTTGVNHKPIIK